VLAVALFALALTAPREIAEPVDAAAPSVRQAYAKLGMQRDYVITTIGRLGPQPGAQSGASSGAVETRLDSTTELNLPDRFHITHRAPSFSEMIVLDTDSYVKNGPTLPWRRMPMATQALKQAYAPAASSELLKTMHGVIHRGHARCGAERMAVRYEFRADLPGALASANAPRAQILTTLTVDSNTGLPCTIRAQALDAKGEVLENGMDVSSTYDFTREFLIEAPAL
jgi:hypothetical protein